MFGHNSRNNGQGKVSLRPQQEIEDLSEEAQPVGSARTRSFLLSGPTLNLALLEELQVNTWLEKLRKGPQEEFDYSHYANMKPENASHSCQASKQAVSDRWDMWRGPANEQTKNKEAATRCDKDLLTIEKIQVTSCPNRSQNMEMQYCCYTHYELFASKCIDALYFYLAWWLATLNQRRLTPGFGF